MLQKKTNMTMMTQVRLGLGLSLVAKQFICKGVSSNPARWWNSLRGLSQGCTYPHKTLSPAIMMGITTPTGMSFLQQTPPQTPWSTYTSCRTLWGMLNAVFNRPDPARRREVGADRACAEWLLRCGAHVKWVGTPTWTTDYNKLPASDFEKFKIEEVNADDAAVMDLGFPHFDGVKFLRKIRFNYCAYLEDGAIEQLTRVKDSLEHLEISSCGDISDRGLASLTELSNLQTLYLHELIGVRDKAGSLQMLQKALPRCQITFTDINRPEKK